ncbi:anaphase-promoting complex subunit 11 RING-H2 finger-domain-containing protein [Aspergillus aurantiobrunneus]
MKVTLKEWNAVATWRWDMPEDEVCGICRVQFDGTCPTCKFPGDDCSLLLGKCGHSFHMPDPSAMSLLKHTSSPALSSPPSKQSLRRPSSRPHSIDQVSRTNGPPDEQRSQQIASNIDSHPADKDGQTHHESPSQSHILSQPFFTLIEDAHTSEYYHPTVHYIFSDDDTDIVTEAALRSLDSEKEGFPNTNTKGKLKATGQEPADRNIEETSEDESPAKKECLLPDPISGVRDNYIILDIDHIHPAQSDEYPAGASPETQGQTAMTSQPNNNPSNNQKDLTPSPNQLTVTSAHSLSPSWQVLNSRLVPAPTFENNSSGEQPLNGGLMLQIQGTSGLPVGALNKDKERGSQRLEDMMDQFARRLDELKSVIESGERGLTTGVEGSLHDENPLQMPEAQDVSEERQISLSKRRKNTISKTRQACKTNPTQPKPNP